MLSLSLPSPPLPPTFPPLPFPSLPYTVSIKIHQPKPTTTYYALSLQISAESTVIPLVGYSYRAWPVGECAIHTCVCTLATLQLGGLASSRLRWQNKKKCVNPPYLFCTYLKLPASFLPWVSWLVKPQFCPLPVVLSGLRWGS